MRSTSRKVRIEIWAINLSRRVFLTFCEDVKRLGNLIYIFFGYNPNMTVDDYHTLEAAVLASPSVITGLEIIDDKKSPKIEWEFTAEELKVRLHSDPVSSNPFIFFRL